ncbi:MAG: U32 family peptidase [Candidatus Gastranaerophilales bacterium]|nr:U32 family peptidase [Candidatus Gastranaerophilales bacterium]
MKSDKVLKTRLQTAEFELLVPANNKHIAMQAIKAGADAVYIGYRKYGARIQAGNTMEDLVELIEFAHIYRAKVYITLNTILKNEEIKNIEKLIWHLYTIKADGIIIQDMGILECNLPPIPIIASTQCHNNTLEKVKFLENTGFKRVIFPREITLEEIKNISQNTNIELETFVHGALCMSYSGQCYLSYAIGGRSANRGECAQPCRKKYSLKDSEGKYILRDKHILSLKDLNLSDRLEDLILSGVTSFKVEGRLKNESYVVNVTAYYRKKLDEILENYGLKRASLGKSDCDFEPDVYRTFNRGYTNFYLDKEKKDIGTVSYTSSLGEFVGVVQSVKKNYFSLKTNILNNGDGICFFNDEKVLVGTNINKTEGDFVFPLSIKGIKTGVKIYRNYNKAFDDKLKNANLLRKLVAKIKVRETSLGYIFFLTDEENNTATYMLSKDLELAQNKEKALSIMQVQLSKSGNTEFRVKETDIKIKNVPFIKVAKINEIRRILTENLRKIRRKNYKYNYRRTPINVVDYPLNKVDYRANIYNDKALEFYKKRGVFVEEMALENQKDTKNREVMISKYCIKNQLGLCPKQTSVKKYSEPYVLIDEFNKVLLVEFNCKDCVMKIKTC